MEHGRRLVSLAVAATILLTTNACSDGPTTPAPVYLMGRTTGAPGGSAAAAPPTARPSHSQIVAAAPPPPMTQPRSPSQHHASRRLIGEQSMALAQKNHGHKVATQTTARRLTYHAAHESSVAAASPSPEQIPLDEPVAPASAARAPASMGPSSRQPTTSWISPPPREHP